MALLGVRSQEWIAFAVVALTAAAFARSVFRRKLAPILADYLLEKGHVKWAMRLRHGSKTKDCC
jgi:hypothetical protein